MSYLQPSNKNGKKNNKRTFIVILIVCVFVVLTALFPQGAFSIAYSIFSPFWKFETYVTDTFSYSLQMLRAKDSLVRENENFRRNELTFQATELSLNEALAQNSSLKDLLGRSEKFKYVLGVIVRRPPYSAYDTIIIDVGSNSLVEVGNKVFAPGKVLIGDVVEVYPNSAKVSLFSSAGREIPVVIGDKNIEARAFGRGGGNFVVEVPVGAELLVGDTVKAPSVGISILGVIENIKPDQSGSLQSMLFKSPFNIHDLYFVEIETNSLTKEN